MFQLIVSMQIQDIKLLETIQQLSLGTITPLDSIRFLVESDDWIDVSVKKSGKNLYWCDIWSEG